MKLIIDGTEKTVAKVRVDGQMSLWVDGTPTGTCERLFMNNIAVYITRDIDAAPPPPPPDGKWKQTLLTAPDINNYDPKTSLFSAGGSVGKGQTVYFHIDPLKYSSYKPPGRIRVGLRDPVQGDTMNLSQDKPTVIKVDQSGNELKRFDLAGSGDFDLTFEDYSSEEFNSSTSFLLEVTESGKGSGTSTVYWRWV